MKGIICGIQRHLEETMRGEALNPLDASDLGERGYSTCIYYVQSKTIIFIKDYS